jgi:hypothetical protein
MKLIELYEGNLIINFLADVNKPGFSPFGSVSKEHSGEKDSKPTGC